jgi:hypothetical protein
MPNNRRFFSSSRHSPPPSSSSKSFSNWKQNGTPEIIIGTTILSLVFIDTLIQKYNDNASSLSRKSVIRELELAIQDDKRKQKENLNNNSNNSDQENMSNITSSHPLIDLNGKEHVTLFKCEIMKIPKYFDGTKSLKNVKVNDVVHIIQEFVGPDSSYHLCKIEKGSDDDNTRIRGSRTNTSSNKEESSIHLSNDKNNSLIDRLETRYNYGWFPVQCLKKLE